MKIALRIKNKNIDTHVSPKAIYGVLLVFFVLTSIKSNKRRLVHGRICGLFLSIVYSLILHLKNNNNKKIQLKFNSKKALMLNCSVL
jgi:hypothetical protein